VEFGAHLPLIDFGGGPWQIRQLRDYASAVRDLGYAWLTANDHLVFPRPWLDGPTALAPVLDCTGDMTLATTVALPVVRGPLAMAKTLNAIDLLSGGRLVAGVGPGSSPRDYEAVGVPFDERWKRLEESVHAMRSLFRGEPHAGTFYSTEGISFEPKPARAGGTPIWLGSWGSEAGIRRVARIADGWLASAYNTTPADFTRAKSRLEDALKKNGRPPAFPNGIGTAWTYVTEDASEAERVLTEVLAPMLRREPDVLRAQLPIGAPEHCAALLSEYAAAGAQRVIIWPLRDEPKQLDTFASKVAPLVK
jgi:alkanesulfonate monooxygenase SsuD/methylene tetrahydromethanopterin reductase-like flavin-dependent oxidoreductase (luciferase family)